MMEGIAPRSSDEQRRPMRLVEHALLTWNGQALAVYNEEEETERYEVVDHDATMAVMAAGG